ncbi:MAG: hypothetical protein LBJ95_03320 [Oscillospiraceae bacterium]|nr:hypothetical protein [Oscillospiraceae bacterium]
MLYVPPTIIPLKIPNEVIHVPDGETTYDIGNNIKFCVLLAEDQKNTTTYIQLPWPTGPVFELRALDDELHRPIEASSVCELGTGSYDATTDAATYTGSLSLAEEHIVQLLAGQKDSDGEYINRVYYYRFEADTQLATLSYVYDPKAETLEIVLDFGKFAQLPIYRAGKEIGGTQPETLINKIKVSVVFTDDEETFLPESPSTYDGNIMTLSYTSLPNLDGQTLRVILNTSSRNILSDHTLEFTIYVPPQYPPQIAVNYDVDNARLIAAISHLFRISPSLNIQQRFAYGAPVDITDKVEIVPSEIDQTNELPAGKQLTCTFAPDQSCITVIGFAYQVPSTTAKSATETRYYYFLGSNAHYAPLLASYDDSDGQLACQLNLAALRNLPAISFEGGDTTTLSGTYNHSFRILGDETHVEQPLPLIFPSFNSADSHRLTLSVLEDCAGRVLRTFFPMDGDTVPGLPAIDTTIQSALKICPWCNEIIEPTWQHSSIPVLQSWIVRHKFCRDKMTLVVIPMHHCCEIAFGATAFESSRGKNRIIAETSTPFTQRNAADIEKPLARYHLGPNVKIQYSARLRSAHWRGPDSTFLFT